MIYLLKIAIFHSYVSLPVLFFLGELHILLIYTTMLIYHFMLIYHQDIPIKQHMITIPTIPVDPVASPSLPCGGGGGAGDHGVALLQGGPLSIEAALLRRGTTGHYWSLGNMTLEW